MRLLPLLCFSLLLWSGCRDYDDAIAPTPCEDPVNRYYVHYDFGASSGVEFRPRWLFFSDPSGYHRAVHAVPPFTRNGIINEDAVCYTSNPITSIFSYFVTNLQTAGYISIETFAEVPTQSRLERYNTPRFSSGGNRPAASLVITDLPTSVDTIISTHVSSYQYDEVTHSLTMNVPALHIFESRIWIQLRLDGEDYYHCREFSPTQDFDTPHAFETFSFLSFDKTLLLDHDVPLDGWYDLYGMQEEHSIHRSLISNGLIKSGNTLELQVPEDAYPYYLLKVINNDDDAGDLFYYNIFSDLPDVITPNESAVAVAYSGTYPTYEVTSENADLLELNFFQKFDEEEVSVSWRIHLPGAAVQQVNIPQLANEIKNSLPILSQIDFDNNFTIDAYHYFEYDEYSEVQPFLFKKQPNELWNFRSRFVKVSAERQ